MDVFSKRIKERRLFCGYTLLEVAQKLGISESNLQRYESGQVKNVPYRNIVSMANIFGCTPSFLMGWADIPEEKSDRLPIGAELPSELNGVQVAFSGGAADGLTQDDIDMLVDIAERMKKKNADRTGNA